MKSLKNTLLRSILASLSLITVISLSSCGTSPKKKSTPEKSSNPSMGSRQALAKKILAHPKITLLKKQVSGRVDGASAYHNIASAARGYSAKRSYYGNAPGGYTRLNTKMLRTMLYLANTKGYSYRVTSIAGGSHSRRSRHYNGVAVDIDMINGRKVGYGNPYYRSVMRTGRAKGATEVLGPGDRAHSSHVHLAWPR